MRVTREEVGKMFLEERLDAHLVQPFHHHRSGKLARFRGDLCGPLLPHAWAAEYAVHAQAAPAKRFAEHPRLLLAQRREAVVVLFEGRRLAVADEEERAHAGRENTLTPTSRQATARRAPASWPPRPPCGSRSAPLDRLYERRHELQTELQPRIVLLAAGSGDAGPGKGLTASAQPGPRVQPHPGALRLPQVRGGRLSRLGDRAAINGLRASGEPRVPGTRGPPARRRLLSGLAGWHRLAHDDDQRPGNRRLRRGR